jgi:broad specificity phosphatase PhoE
VVESFVYLVRHGRTTLNAEGKFRGRLDRRWTKRDDETRAQRLTISLRAMSLPASPALAPGPWRPQSP